jgi:hypothetical protein
MPLPKTRKMRNNQNISFDEMLDEVRIFDRNLVIIGNWRRLREAEMRRLENNFEEIFVDFWVN